MEQIVNKVADSGIITLDLVKFLPQAEIIGFDIKPFLFKEMILKEKDYRESLKNFDWSEFEGKAVAVFCSVDAIIPVWAYMLATTYLQKVAADIYFGTEDELKKNTVLNNINTIDAAEYEDKRIVVKGCGDILVPDYAYVEITKLLMPFAKSIMYGEPCSTVPLYKKPLKKN